MKQNKAENKSSAANKSAQHKSSTRKVIAGEKLRGAEKVARIPVKVEKTQQRLRKPEWIRVKVAVSPQVKKLKKILRQQKLFTVCEEAACPNLGECFGHGTATFMVMGEICTRRCPFCDVGHGRPLPLDQNEPINLAKTIRAMALKYVVITSVDRDDLRDGGADHFAKCIQLTRELNPDIKVEVLVPDFRGRVEVAMNILTGAPPDVFNHNLETVPRLYKQSRPGADYIESLQLLRRYKEACTNVVTKSGLMLGLGENKEEVIEVLKDMREYHVDMLTLGQYLQPSEHHLPVKRYVTPAEFDELKQIALQLGFSQVASGPMVRSSYHADLQAQGAF
jgi:lipoic acid synthetase